MARVPAWVRYLAIAGNAVYFLWIAYNAIDDGFRAGRVELVAGMGLLVLLALNAFLLFRLDC